MNARLAAVLGACAGLLAASCGPSLPPCSAADLAAVEAAYSARVISSCKGYSFDSCPAVPGLKLDRRNEQIKAGCR